MSVFSATGFDDHEQVVYCCDPAAGLRAIVAIHNTNLGPSLGGCRMWRYDTDDEALRDALRLSRGMNLARALHRHGARLWVTDIYAEQVRQAVAGTGATAVGADDIYGLDVDVFAPCALGAAINDDTLPRLRAAVVAGAANNQFAEARHGRELMQRGILYAPDYVINAGGIIDIYHERIGYRRDRAVAHIEGIGETLRLIFERAEREGKPTNEVADRMAEERIGSRASERRPAAGRERDGD